MSTTGRLISAAFGGVCIGVGVGYIVAEKHLAAKFDDRLARETEEMREFYTIHRKKYPTPEAAVADLIPEPALTSDGVVERVAYHKIVKQYNSDEDPEEELAVEAEIVEGPDGTLMISEVMHHNIFNDKGDPSKPYIISEDEYVENEPEYEQSSLTYYEKDQVLTDHREDFIENSEMAVGTAFAVNFGHGSNDDNTVHVRNETLRMDFEIVKSEGSYRVDVLGEDEIPIERPSSRQRSGD